MAIYSGTYYFRADVSGWQEKWYFEDAGDLNTARSNFLLTVPWRRACLGQGAGVFAVSVRPNEALRISRASVTLTTGNVILAANARDTPWNAVLMRIGTASGSRRSAWLRGVEDDDIQYAADNTPIISARLKQNVTSWWAQMLAINVRFSNYIPLAQQESTRVNGVFIDTTVTPPMIWVGVEGFLPTVSINDNILIAGVRGRFIRQVPPGTRGVNGTWRVLGSAPAPNRRYRIGLPANTLPSAPVWETGGMVYGRRRDWFASDGFPPALLRFARKKTGRPAYVSAGSGRRRKRVF